MKCLRCLFIILLLSASLISIYFGLKYQYIETVHGSLNETGLLIMFLYAYGSIALLTVTFVIFCLFTKNTKRLKTLINFSKAIVLGGILFYGALSLDKSLRDYSLVLLVLNAILFIIIQIYIKKAPKYMRA